MGQDSRVGRKPEVTDDDIVDVVASFDDPVATTSEIAAQLPISRRRVHDRLKALRDADRVRAKDVGSRSRVWWVEGRTGRRESVETAARTDRDREIVDVVEREQDDESDARGGGPEAALAGVDFPESVDRDAAIKAVGAAHEFVHDSGPVSKGDVVAAVMPDHSLGYDVDGALAKVEASGERYRGGWWRKVIKPGLGAFDDVEYRNGVGWRVVDDAR